MTLLLAGVCGPGEAMIALDAGADIIDLRDPAGASLPAEVLRAAVAAIAGRRLTGAAAGILPADCPPAVAMALADTGVDYLRIGLPASPDHGALAVLARRIRLIASLFVPPDAGQLSALAAAGVEAVILDTLSGRLLDAFDLPALGRFVAAAQAAGLRACLAGGLEAPDVPRLMLLRPDILEVRLGRSAGLRRIRALIPAYSPAGAAPPGIDIPRRAARQPSADAEPPPTDRIFVHDFVLPVRIGAYAAEHAAPQRVRFDVEALVTRTGRPAREMADVFSYDLITDGIRLLVAGGHFQLVETLAERIAAVVLAHRRVAQVSVRVTKLETGSGALGIEIERVRATAPAVERVEPGSPAAILPLPLRPRT